MRTALYPSLNRRDCDALLASIDTCLAILKAKPGVPTAAELRMRSMLSTLRTEVRDRAVELDGSRPGGHPGAPRS